MLQVLFVFLTLALVIFLVFKKWNIILVSIVAAAVLAILDGQNILTALTDLCQVHPPMSKTSSCFSV